MDAEIWFTFTILLYCKKTLQVRKEFKNVYMRWKTKDKTYGIQKPTQHFVRGIFTLFTSLCLTRPLSLNETFYIHWFVLSWKHVLFFTCSSPLFDHLFIRSIHGLPCLYPSHFSATLLSDRTSTLLVIQHFSISLNKHPRSKKRPPPNKCPPSGAPSKPPLPPPPLPSPPSFPQLVGIPRKTLSFATSSIIYQASTAAESEQEIYKRPLRFRAILPIGAPSFGRNYITSYLRKCDMTIFHCFISILSTTMLSFSRLLCQSKISIPDLINM